MVRTTDGLPRVSAAAVERSLAALLVGLLGMYALGTVGSTVVPVLETAGVIAIHLAVVVASVFPVAVVVHAAKSRTRPAAPGPGRLEVGTATAALGCLAVALWFALDAASQLSTVLFGCATGALLILVGLVAGRP